MNDPAFLRDRGAGAQRASSLTVRECSPWRLPRDWEAFSNRCGCSHAAMGGSIAVRALRSVGRGGARCLEIFIEIDGSREKLAQATVFKERGRYWFLHQLAVPQEFANQWGVAMHGLLCHLGPGPYGYCWVVNDEDSRAQALQRLPGVQIEKIRPLFYQSVRFKNWKSWDDYLGRISTNAKRNYKRAIKEIDELNIVTKTRVGDAARIAIFAQM
jgi:hypothetical protein